MSLKLILTLLSALFLTSLGASPNDTSRMVLAGGCFWCIESAFDNVKGVKSATSGYSGGSTPNPSYAEVSSGSTTYLESVEVRFDPKVISTEALLDIFWKNIDPTDEGGQFADRGHHYTTAIFYSDDQQKEKAEFTKKKLQDSKKFSKNIVTKILPLKNFYPAEDYHQDYHKKHPQEYKRYRYLSGRTPFLEKYWGKAPN